MSLGFVLIRIGNCFKNEQKAEFLAAIPTPELRKWKNSRNSDSGLRRAILSPWRVQVIAHNFFLSYFLLTNSFLSSTIIIFVMASSGRKHDRPRPVNQSSSSVQPLYDSLGSPIIPRYNIGVSFAIPLTYARYSSWEGRSRESPALRSTSRNMQI